MSQSDDEVNRREVAYRLFAAEFDDADFSYAESDEERAPNYVVTPTGARVNRVFVVGVLTEVEQVNEDVVRARIVDPTGAFVVYAGQYQPEALAALESADTPSFVAVTGKARTFEPDDADVVYTSIRPESVSEVDAETRDRWVVTTAEQTVDRVATMAAAHERVERDDTLRDVLDAAGVEHGLAAGIPLALDHYDTSPAYLAAVRALALDAARVVAGDMDAAGELSLAPGEGGDAPLPFAADLDADVDTADEAETDEADPSAAAEPEATDDEPVDAEVDSDADEAEPTEAESETAEAESEESEPADASPDEVAETPSPDEVAAEAAPDADAESDGEGETDGEPAATGAEPAAAEQAADDGEMYELSEEEREEVEENFDVGFSSGDEIPEAGEADIDAPDPDEGVDAAPDEAEVATDGDDLGDFDDGDDEDADDLDDFTESAYDESDSDAEDDESPPPDLDLEDYVVDLMEQLDDGDGAPRDEVVTTAADDLDADEGEIEDAIQAALMGGRCYESGEDHLKAI